ncbi:uncharacterized protein BO80DRAFT_461769 [Aspergillus ibericus CBS 121593]|uniref:Uncharacterized protein n=1 Tax=Aspergillus ibericus CBS 121593 TaxID=1448316 RepID=A0A395HAV7_9EURO|nr:hypothetical protein BO80DRAFT_461769 [Aspergillus ibericus CBS 121593]RAL04709.1 hypothetical protein BO80DRAFT_461769 [Aspergillus ibericus CBS 121593]
MPRTLPWLNNGATIKREPKVSTPRRDVKPETTKDPKSESDVTPKAETPRSRTKKRDFFRSSPTPPSSPIHRCPSEEYLREGFDHDDIYMMVEDEFYAVAQTFTQHLHYAEYLRRKKEAKLQNATAIQSIARPTDGVTPTSDEARKKAAAAELAAQQKAGLQKLGNRPAVDSEEETEEEQEEDRIWAGTSLHDLMISPRKARSLVGMQGIKSSTRAAAGLQAPGTSRGSGYGVTDGAAREVEEDLLGETTGEDDDLDARTRTPTRPSRTQPRSTSSLRSSSLHRATGDGGMRSVQSMSGRYSTPTATKSKKRLLLDDFDGLPEPHQSPIELQGQESSPSVGGRGPNPRGVDPKTKKSRLNEVPTFLF